jgi:hypothetical protein
MVGRILSAALAALALGFGAGCPSNVCLLTVNGQCKWSTCPEGADFDAQARRCACRADRVSAAGGCLTLDQANQYCGRGAHWDKGGCAKIECPAGLTIDQDTGTCLTPLQAAAVAGNAGVQVGQNQKLGCAAGSEIVVEGQQASCVPIAQTCGKDEQWDGEKCRKVAPCPPGGAYDAASRGCVQFAQAGQTYTVVLRTWMATNFGADGGAGTSAFCGAFGKHPLAFGVAAGRSLRLRVVVQVEAPGRRIADAFVLTTGVAEAGGQPVGAKGGAEIQSAATAILGSLKAGLGESDGTTGLVTVSCTVVNTSKPTAVTVTGGA